MIYSLHHFFLELVSPLSYGALFVLCSLAFVIGSIVSAIACSLIAGPLCHLFATPVRDMVPERHRRKHNTPSMGGMAFAVVLLGSCFLSVIAPSISFPLFTYQLPAALYVQAVVFCAFAAIGLCDDLYKRWYRKGITERQKSLAQIAVSMACATFLWYGAGFTSVCIPLINYSVPLGILYVPYAAFIMIATSNAVNITDGIDGLAASALFPTFFAGIAVACLLKMAALAWGCSATCGALFAFFLFNRHPAKLFMGDVGSLGLGGLLAWCFLVMRTELLLPLLALVPVIETVSVMVQVAVYKKTGKRVLRMAPLHHHLELLGWSEWKIVGVAALLSVLAALAGWLIIRAS